MARKTKEPKKLKVERDSQKFRCSWKNGEEYDQGVQFYYSYGVTRGSKGGFYDSSIKDLAKGASSKTVADISFSDFHPRDKGRYLQSFSFSVRGNRKKHKEKKKTVDPGWSDWITSDIFEINKPNNVSMGTPELLSSIKCSFPYTLPKEGQHTPYVDIEWESCLVKGGASPNWAKPDSSSYHKGIRTKNQTTTITIQEDQYKGTDIDWTVPNYSYTRYVRIRARGPGGNSEDWTVKKHVYSKAQPAQSVSAKLTKNSERSGYLCGVTWTSPTSTSRPTDTNVVNYTFTHPDENGGCPSSEVSWTEVDSRADTGGKDSYSFYLSDPPGPDQVMFVRVDTYHDGVATPGDPTYVKGSKSTLTAPALGSVTPNTETHRVELNGITSNTGVPGTFMAIHYRGANETGDGQCVGITSQGDAIIQLPAWGTDGFALGIQSIFNATYEGSSSFTTQEVDESIPLGGTTVTVTTDNTPIPETKIDIVCNTSVVDEFVVSFTCGEGMVFHRTDCDIRFSYDGNDTIECRTNNDDPSFEASIKNISYYYVPNSSSNLVYYSIIERPDKSDAVGTIKSDIAWTQGAIPLPPSNVKVQQDGVNTLAVSWDWNWKEANVAELSWSTNEDAWESTDEPQTYTITGVKPSRWKISNLEPGNWYVRLRLIKQTDESEAYGSYAKADIYPIKVSSAPSIPTLTLLPEMVTVDGNTTASWAYEADDGTTQSSSEIFEATDDGNGGYIYTSLNPPVTTTSAQFINIYPEVQGWKEGETHNLSLIVKSSAEELSEDYSLPKPVTVVPKPTVEITSLNLASRTREVDAETHETETKYVLTGLPLIVTVVGAGEGGTTYVSILRDGPYHGTRPDGTDRDGFDNEVIASASHSGEDEFEFTMEDLNGNYFDDGGSYKILATVRDSYGQTISTNEIESNILTDEYVSDGVATQYQLALLKATDITVLVIDPDPENLQPEESAGHFVTFTFNDTTGMLTLDQAPMEDAVIRISYSMAEPTFDVWWDHQAVIPDAKIEPDLENDVAYITPQLPEELPNNWEFDEGDTCDIYRLSADAPELIKKGAEIGVDPPVKYVDPYPALGQFGGYRVVYVTANGDYTAGDLEAVSDFFGEEAPYIDKFETIIDFASDRIVLPYDISVSHKWSKDTTITKYLDGSVVADWNPAVEMTSTVNTTVIIQEDPEQIEALRRLANYPGHCHIRTPEGSSFVANIEVNEDHEEKWVNQIGKFSLSITRVDNPFEDGIKYDDWYVAPEEEEESEE